MPILVYVLGTARHANRVLATAATTKRFNVVRTASISKANILTDAIEIRKFALVLWLDPGYFLSRPLTSIFTRVNSLGAFFIREKGEIAASVIGLKKNSNWTEAMLPTWRDCSLLPDECPLQLGANDHGQEQQDLPGILTPLYRQAREALGALELVAMKNILEAVTHRDVSALPRGCRTPPSRNGYHRDPRLLVYVGVLTAPQHVGKRTILRNKCLPLWRSMIERGQLRYDFVAGVPTDPTSAEWEQKQSQKMWAERAKFQDLYFMAGNDTYPNLPIKTLAILKRGLSLGAAYIMKMDDDMCFIPEYFFRHLRKARHPRFTYIGNFLWREPNLIAAAQTGPDNRSVSYMAGPSYALSFPLARMIAGDDHDHSLLYAMYGTDSEDLDMGRWVEFVETSRHLNVTRVMAKIAVDYRKVQEGVGSPRGFWYSRQAPFLEDGDYF